MRLCILLWMSGRASHLDTFDLKPDAPLISRRIQADPHLVPGLDICELLPRVAEVADRFASSLGFIMVSRASDGTQHVLTGISRRPHYGGTRPRVRRRSDAVCRSRDASYVAISYRLGGVGRPIWGIASSLVGRRRSATSATRGNNSQISSPGTQVWIGLYSPRYSVGRQA